MLPEILESECVVTDMGLGNYHLKTVDRSYTFSPVKLFLARFVKKEKLSLTEEWFDQTQVLTAYDCAVLKYHLKI